MLLPRAARREPAAPLFVLERPFVQQFRRDLTLSAVGAERLDVSDAEGTHHNQQSLSRRTVRCTWIKIEMLAQKPTDSGQDQQGWPVPLDSRI
jgi:hypothetical protein